MADLAFNNKQVLEKLESIIHGYVWKQAKEFISKHKQEKLIVLDVPLLIESGWHKKGLCLANSYSEAEQIKRAMARDSITEEEVRARIRAQMPLSEKKKYATIILDKYLQHFAPGRTGCRGFKKYLD